MSPFITRPQGPNCDGGCVAEEGSEARWHRNDCPKNAATHAAHVDPISDRDLELLDLRRLVAETEAMHEIALGDDYNFLSRFPADAAKGAG